MSALATALVSAQKAMPTLHKDSEAEVLTKTGGRYKYQYLGLEALLAQVRPVLNEHGLALMQTIVWDERGFHALTTSLLHEKGETTSSTMRLPVGADASAQVLGSAMTYGRRYAVLAALALAPDEDDDGQKASTVEVRNRQSSEAGGHAGGTASEQPASEGFQAPLPATEKPVDKGVLDEIGSELLRLNEAFPEHPGQGRTWADVAREHSQDRFQKSDSKKLTLAEGHELRAWLEDEYQQAAREAQIPFETTA